MVGHRAIALGETRIPWKRKDDFPPPPLLLLALPLSLRGLLKGLGVLGPMVSGVPAKASGFAAGLLFPPLPGVLRISGSSGKGPTFDLEAALPPSLESTGPLSEEERVAAASRVGARVYEQ